MQGEPAVYEPRILPLQPRENHPHPHLDLGCPASRAVCLPEILQPPYLPDHREMDQEQSWGPGGGSRDLSWWHRKDEKGDKGDASCWS